MPTYEYACEGCGHRFERFQPITAPSVATCPECGGAARRLIVPGAGFIIKGAQRERDRRPAGGCSLDERGVTCCGRDERCGAPPCGTRR
jgi:putative FmdB family regulatory protein